MVDATEDGEATVGSACSEVLLRTVGAGPPPRDCGVLCASAVRRDGCIEVELSAVHIASQSMAVAYVSQGGGGERASDAVVLRRRERAEPLEPQCMAFGTSWPLPS